ncbi:HAD-IA family hydrolase [Acinetobacter sp. 194]|uniref:HAD-IA family hydrolase n=1 Tax=Acinetobacter shaoyimingii TaxID=2715164 RepID=UPI00140CFAC1|nr:HAD-IA family hydrolase [Acinetobacter shaoyimingii]NHB57398.1 HAD-IA family hydrolase [Acinetobacter shaoyimingii]
MSNSDTKPIIMFDMDGTLLDLAFDDLLWNHKLPERYAQTHGCTLEQSQAELYSFYQQYKHTLCWYSSSYWTEKIGVDVLQLQYDYKDKIRPRLGCFELLDYLKQNGYRCWLLTNADQVGLKLKLETINLTPYFEVMISSQEIGHAKEFVEFWQILQQKHPFDPKNTIFIDDTAPVLQGAEKFGIENLLTITQPSSESPARHALELEYPALNNLTELISILENKTFKVSNVKTA